MLTGVVTARANMMDVGERSAKILASNLTK